MEWVEVIQLRITRRDTAEILSTIKQLVEEARVEDSCQKIRMFQRTDVDTDLSILLFHGFSQVKKGGTSLGIRMRSALKDFGMVNHHTWSEVGTHCKI